MHAKILFFGFSKFAKEIAKLCKNKELSFMIIDSDAALVEKAKAEGYYAYTADLSDDNELIAAGITKEVTTLFCVSEEANQNLFITLSARALDPKLRIISLGATKESEKKLLLAGANKVFNPYEIGAKRLFRYMRKPTLFTILDQLLFGQSEIDFGEIVVNEKCAWNNLSLRTIDEKIGDGLVLIGVKSKDEFIFDTIRSQYCVKIGDVVVVMGDATEISNKQKELVL